MKISRLLIANRGEIALRIMRTCRMLGISPIAVYSESEKGHPHVRAADESFLLGETLSTSYLDAGRILEAAKKSNTDAIHPGYGFLSESPHFARAVESAGMLFVGPAPETMEQLGEKNSARILAGSAGVPVSPGYDGNEQTDGRFQAEAKRLGVPLIIKAVSGGGGRGMRVVTDLETFLENVHSARREAKAGFGDDRLLLERYITKARHIEVQLFGDGLGEVIHLFERDCSVQRRNQKIIEEAPAPNLPEKKRRALLDAAVKLGKAVRLRNATTAEFLVFEDGENGVPEGFIFLEANTRLQVEHPVTEELVGLDLIELQLKIASGSVTLDQKTIKEKGAAIEARIYSEDPTQNFVPSGGVIHSLRLSAGAGVRNEHAIEEGMNISTSFDPMLAKVITSGSSREEARKQLISALEETMIEGFETNIPFLNAVLSDPDFVSGKLHTGMLSEIISRGKEKFENLQSAALACYLGSQIHLRAAGALLGRGKSRKRFDPFVMGNFHRIESAASGTIAAPVLHYRLYDPIFGTSVELPGRIVGVIKGAPCRPAVQCEVGDGKFSVVAESFHPATGYPTRILVDGSPMTCAFQDSLNPQSRIRFSLDSVRFEIELLPGKSPLGRAEATKAGTVVSPLPGNILTLPVQVGDPVSKGQVVATLESMKMEHAVTSPVAGTIREVCVIAGQTVRMGEKILRVE